MDFHLTLAVNMAIVPGVTQTVLVRRPNGSIEVTVHGGHPKVVAAMILRCLPPDTLTEGDTVVEIEGTVVKLNHVDPTPEQPEDFVAPLPLVTPEGRHEPMGDPSPTAAAKGAKPRSRTGVLIVAGVLLLLGGILLGVVLSL